MWEIYIGLIVLVMVYGFIKLATGLKESDTGSEEYDKLQAVGINALKVLFSLLAIISIFYGLALTPHVIEASISSNNQTSLVNTTAINNINSLTEGYEDVTFITFLLYLFVSLIFFLAFIFIMFEEKITGLVVGKGRRKNE